MTRKETIDNLGSILKQLNISPKVHHDSGFGLPDRICWLNKSNDTWYTVAIDQGGKVSSQSYHPVDDILSVVRFFLTSKHLPLTLRNGNHNKENTSPITTDIERLPKEEEDTTNKG